MRHSILLSLVGWALASTAGSASAQQFTMKHPEWSPGGNQIAFEADFDGAINIYVANLDGSGVRQLTFGAAMDSYPRYSPDGQSLVFLSRRHKKFSLHFVSTADGKERGFLAADGNLEPDFSPDGLQVVFRSYLHGNAEIMIAKTDGTDLRRLTDNQVEDGFPAFSSDGQSIFFHRSVGEFKQIFMMDLKSGAEVQLTQGDFNSWHAHSSPDGRNIVYDGNKGGDRNIFRMDIEKRNPVQLTDAPGRDGYPKWSPDGGQIAFHTARDGAMRVYLMDANGENERPFTPLTEGQ